MLSSRTPTPTSATAASGSPASSPQTPTQRPCASAASTTAAMRRSTGARDAAPSSEASVALPRSAAIVYWARSFVPIEKKSTSGATCAAASASAGTSTMTPTSSSAALPRAARSASRCARAARSSSSVATIGNISFSGCSAATRRTARSWVRNSSGSASERRIPRRPRNGLSSGAWRRNGSGLSAPASSVRTISGRPSSASAISVRTATCSSSLGGSSRSRKRNSVRSRPTPSAPCSTAVPGVGRAADVRDDLDAAAVAQRSGLAGPLEGLGAGGVVGATARFAGGDRGGVGVDLDGALLAVEDQRRALLDRQQRLAEADDGGDAERAGEDRRVAGRAAARGGDRVGPVGVQRRRLARRQLVGEHDARLVEHRRERGAGQVAEHAARDVLDVDRPLPHVRDPPARGTTRRRRRRPTATRAPRPRRRRSRRSRARAARRRRAAARGRRRSPPRSRPPRPAMAARAASRSRRTAARAASSRSRSSSTDPTGPSSTTGSGARSRRAAPIAIPGDAATPTSRPPASGAPPPCSGAGSSGRSGVGRVAPVRGRERADGVERGGGLGPAREHADLVARVDAEHGEPGEAAPVGRPAALGRVGDLDLGVEPAQRGHEPRRRPRVEPEPVLDAQPQLLPRAEVGRSLGGIGVVAAELLGLHPDRAAGLAGDLVERGAAAGAGGGGDRALDERRVGEHGSGRRPGRPSRPRSRRS